MENFQLSAEKGRRLQRVWALRTHLLGASISVHGIYEGIVAAHLKHVLIVTIFQRYLASRIMNQAASETNYGRRHFNGRGGRDSTHLVLVPATDNLAPFTLNLVHDQYFSPNCRWQKRQITTYYFVSTWSQTLFRRMQTRPDHFQHGRSASHE